MKVVLNSVMMSMASILFMTLLTLGITKIHAQETQQNRENSQQELIDLFFAAAKTGNQDVINEFLTYGFPVNVRNRAGYTPLMMAAYYGHQNTVTTLLEYGADPCARDSKGNTALMGAMFKLEWKIVKQLYQASCDDNPQQKTAADFAKVIGQEEKFENLSHGKE